jgi:hypothetical protein
MMTIISTWTTLETVKDTVLDGKIGAMTSIAAVIAAILAAMSVLKTSKDYVNGHGTDLWSLIRPLVLLLMTCQFNALVLRPLDSMINIFTRDIASNVNITTSEYISKWGENMLDMGEIALETNKQEYFEELAEQAEKSFVTQFFMTIWLSFKKLLLDRFHIASLTIGSAIGGILFLIVKILLFVQQLLSSTYQMINALLGPFVIALGILPSFENGIKNWIARYVQIAMWVPIGYFMMYINLQIGTSFCNMAAANGASLSMEWFMIALQMVALVSVAAVPKIAAWVIESTGANDAHGSLSMPARTAARKLIKF